MVLLPVFASAAVAVLVIVMTVIIVVVEVVTAAVPFKIIAVVLIAPTVATDHHYKQ